MFFLLYIIMRIKSDFLELRYGPLWVYKKRMNISIQMLKYIILLINWFRKGQKINQAMVAREILLSRALVLVSFTNLSVSIAWVGSSHHNFADQNTIFPYSYIPYNVFKPDLDGVEQGHSERSDFDISVIQSKLSERTPS